MPEVELRRKAQPVVEENFDQSPKVEKENAGTVRNWRESAEPSTPSRIDLIFLSMVGEGQRWRLHICLQAETFPVTVLSGS